MNGIGEVISRGIRKIATFGLDSFPNWLKLVYILTTGMNENPGWILSMKNEAGSLDWIHGGMSTSKSPRPSADIISSAYDMNTEMDI